jgi:hypothetical protein
MTEAYAIAADDARKHGVGMVRMVSDGGIEHIPYAVWREEAAAISNPTLPDLPARPAYWEDDDGITHLDPGDITPEINLLQAMVIAMLIAGIAAYCVLAWYF